MKFEELPLELIIKICNLLNFTGINNLFFVSKNLANILRNTIPIISNEEFTQNFIAKIINTNNLANKILARNLINNSCKKNVNPFHNWFSMIKLRFLPLFRIQDKFRHHVNCLGNQFIHAKYMNHYEKNIMNYPDIFITGDYKIEDGKNITNLDINYHNGLFNNTLGEKEIIFSIRVNTTFENRHFYSNSDIYIGDIRLSLSSKGYVYLCSKEFKNRFRFLLENYKTKNNIKEGEIEIEFPKYENLVKRDNHILFTCYIMSKLLSIKIDSNKISSNIVTDIMNNYMGNKKNNIQDILFGNLREYYIPSGCNTSI